MAGNFLQALFRVSAKGCVSLNTLYRLQADSGNQSLPIGDVVSGQVRLNRPKPRRNKPRFRGVF